MQGIVFVYDPDVSRKKGQFTIRLEERKMSGGVWMPTGRRRTYTAMDLQRAGGRLLDKALFAMAFKSEARFRESEGRFFSGDEVFTLLRISPYDLGDFVKKSRQKRVLCDGEGNCDGFAFVKDVVPDVEMEEKCSGYSLSIGLNGEKLSRADYSMRSQFLTAVFDKKIVRAGQGLPPDFFERFFCGRKIPAGEYDSIVRELSGYRGKIRLVLPGRREKKILKPDACGPVLDIHPSFKFADVGFRYPEGYYADRYDDRDVFFDGKKNLEIHRNRGEEERYRWLLKESGAVFRDAARGAWFLPGGSMETIFDTLESHGFELRVNGKRLRLKTDIRWRIETQDELLFLGGSVGYGQEETDFQPLFDGFLNGQRWFDLPGGSCGLITSGLNELLTALEERGDFKDDEIMFNSYDFTHVQEILKGRENVSWDEAFGGLLAFDKGTGLHFEVPETLGGILRSYQARGVSWMAGLRALGFGGILADDMGLGKTLQVLTLLSGLKADGQSGTSLLIVPKTLIWNWEAEIRKFTPDLTFRLHTGPERTTDRSRFSSVDLVITSYGLVRQDMEFLRTIAWKNLILDEAQAIKNPDSKITRAVKKLVSEFRLTLSGTPVENRPLDMWSQFDFLMPGFLGTRDAFKKRYETGDLEALAGLKTLTRPYIMRRLKKEVCKELPPKTEMTLFCDFEPGQKKIYAETLAAEREKLDRKMGETGKSLSIHILTTLLRLRQIACHPGLVPENTGGDFESGKLDAVLSTAGDILAGGHKILIFSQFTGHLQKVRSSCDRAGMTSFYLDGATKERMAVIDDFKMCDTPCIFFISLKAGGVGLNLTEAGYVFLLDPWWNPAVENQAIDRCYRIGQENPVTVYRFITKGSIEEKVSLLQNRKKLMEQAVVGESDAEGTSLTEEELINLIR